MYGQGYVYLCFSLYISDTSGLETRSDATAVFVFRDDFTCEYKYLFFEKGVLLYVLHKEAVLPDWYAND